jgi:hypothetical protein
MHLRGEVNEFDGKNSVVNEEGIYSHPSGSRTPKGCQTPSILTFLK